MPRGPLMIIGGAEDKLHRRTVLQDFVTASGARDARIVVIPTASSIGEEIMAVYDVLFRKLGAPQVDCVDPASREEAHDEALVALLDDATGVFMTGGNQLKLSGILNGTPVGDAIVRAHHRGVVVAGTSAGASIQSSHMVAFGSGGATPKQRMTQVAGGLGLVSSSVIDQHFEQRNRYGRLLMIVAQSPQLLGIGVDEDTAATVTHEVDDATGEERELLQVSGRGAVTVMDGSRMITNAFEAKRSAPLLASGVVLHVLPAGATYDLTARELVPGETEVAPEDAAELEAVGKDLRRMARDIAASDASPTVLKRRMARLRKLRSAEQSPLDDQPDSQPAVLSGSSAGTPENGASR